MVIKYFSYVWKTKTNYNGYGMNLIIFFYLFGLLASYKINNNTLQLNLIL